MFATTAKPTDPTPTPVPPPTLDPIVAAVLADPGPELPRLRFAAQLKAAGRSGSAARVAVDPDAGFRTAVAAALVAAAAVQTRALDAAQRGVRSGGDELFDAVIDTANTLAAATNMMSDVLAAVLRVEAD